MDHKGWSPMLFILMFLISQTRPPSCSILLNKVYSPWWTKSEYWATLTPMLKICFQYWMIFTQIAVMCLSDTHTHTKLKLKLPLNQVTKLWVPILSFFGYFCKTVVLLQLGLHLELMNWTKDDPKYTQILKQAKKVTWSGLEEWGLLFIYLFI